MTVSLDLDAIAAKSDEDLNEARTASIEQLGRERVAWLALAPRWTAKLAVDTGMLSGFDGDGRDFAAKAEAAGLCESATIGTPEAAPERELLVYIAAGRALTDEQAQRALELVPDDDPHALAELAPALRGSAAEAAVDRALKMTSSERALALIALAPRVKRPHLREEAAAAAQQAPVRSRAQLLVELCKIDPDIALTALATVGMNADVELRARLLRRLAPRFVQGPEPFLDVVRKLPDPAARVDAALRVPCTAATLDEARAWVQQTRAGRARDRARRPLAVAFARAGDIRAAREAARRIERPDTRALTYGDLAAIADPSEGESLLAGVNLALLEAVTPARALAVRATCIRGLVTADRAALAERFAQDAEERLERPDVLTADWFLPLSQFAAALPDGASPAAARAARDAYGIATNLGGARERCEALVSVAPLLGDETASALDQAVSAFFSVSDPLERATLLPALLPALAPSRAAELVDQTAQLARDTAGELRFWMPEAVRVKILTLLSASSGRDTTYLTDQARSAGAAVTAARDRGEPVEKHVLRWAELAVEPSAAEGFLKQYRRAVGVADTTVALDWIDTGTFFCETIPDAALAASVRYAKRQTELLYREARERRAIEPFLEREEQLAAFQALREDDGKAWALHFLGAGGVGKSTLIRHLQRVAADAKIVTAKVDFDYLIPDYPFKRPGELLLQLMAELELYARTEQEEKLVASFTEAITRLHEETAEGTEKDPLEQFDTGYFAAALRAFCGFLVALDREVVLFLDTCEELARFQPRDEAAPTITAAFGLIEAIRGQLSAMGFDRVRFVLAGRRLLASGGYGGWTAAHGFGSAQPDRKYLRIHRIEGFLEEEARRFLRAVRKLEVDDQLIDAVLAASPPPELKEPLVVPGVDDVADDLDPEDDQTRRPQRYNPFDLGMYADWITEEGPMDPAALKSGASDPYIDLRVVRRIQADRVPGLQELLPAVALLWRFDQDLLEPAYRGLKERFVNAYGELADQDWIRSVDDELVVEANLRPRLLKYFTPAIPAAAEALAEGVRRRLQTCPLGEQTPEHVLAASLILEPEEFTDRWHALVADAARAGRWDWLDRVSWRLLTDENGLLTPPEGLRTIDHPAIAAVTAAFCAASLHLRGSAESSYWQAVRGIGRANEDAPVNAWLYARATAALATPEAPEDLRDLILASPGDGHEHDEQLAAALCAALERFEDLSRVGHAAELRAWAERLDAREFGPELRAAAHTLAARLCERERDHEAVEAELDRAFTALGHGSAHEQRWLDWVAPERPLERLRLETLRLGHPPPPDTLRWWGEEAAEQLERIDGERLASAVLRHRLETGVVNRHELEWLTRHNRYDRTRTPTCSAHLETPPLFATTALAWAALGDEDEALDTLADHVELAKETALDPATVFAGERTALRIHRRMRTEDPILVARYVGSEDDEERALGLAVAALTHGVDEQPEGDLTVVPWSFRIGVAPGYGQWLALLGEALEEGTLDWAEWKRLKGERVQSVIYDPTLAEKLRATAVLDASLDVGDLGPLLTRHRLVAETALEVAELLALRLPHVALPLLEMARAQYALAEDTFGAVVTATLTVITADHAQLTARREEYGHDLRAALHAAGGIESLPPAWRRRVEHAQAWCAGTPVVPTFNPSMEPVELAIFPRSPSPAPSPRRQLGRSVASMLTIVVAAVVTGGLLQWAFDALGVSSSAGTSLTVIAVVAAAVGVLSAMLGTLASSQRDEAVNISLARLVVRGKTTALGPPWPPPRPATLRLRLALPRLFSMPQGRGRSIWGPAADVVSLAVRGRYRASSPLQPDDPILYEATDWLTPPPSDYASAARHYPDSLWRPMVTVLHSARRARLALAIEPGRSLAGLPWEALALHASGLDAPLQPFRVGAPARTLRLRRHPRTRISVSTGYEWRALASASMEPWSNSSMFVGDFAEWPDETGVIHAIGRPVSGTSGELLEVGGAATVTGSKGLGSYSGGLTLSPEQLCRAGAITVLQAEPLDADRRFDTEREEAGRLKLLAFDVYTAGAEAVLVVPALPEPLASEIATRLSRALRPPGRLSFRRADDALARSVRRRRGPVEPELRRLLGVADDVRLAIMASAAAPSPVLEELALDVCLYAGGVGRFTTGLGSGSR